MTPHHVITTIANGEPQLSWDGLRLLLEINGCGGVSATGEALGIDASTVRRRLRSMEKKLGASLFETKGGIFMTTPLGRSVVGVARKMAEASSELGRSHIDAKRDLHGVVRVATMEGFASHYLVPRLAMFARQMPQISIELVTSSRPLSLADREADIAVNMTRPSSHGVVMRALGAFTVGLYASSEYLRRKGTPQDVADLTSHDLVGYVDDLLTVHEARWLQELIPSPALRFSSTSLSGQLVAIRNGLGIGIIPAFMAEPAGQGLLRVLPASVLERHWWLVTRENERHMARIRAVADFLVDQVARDLALLSHQSTADN